MGNKYLLNIGLTGTEWGISLTYSFLFLKFIKIVDYLLICYLLIYFVYVYTHRHTYHDMVVRVQLLDSVLSYLVGLRNQTEVVRLEASTYIC